MSSNQLKNLDCCPICKKTNTKSVFQTEYLNKIIDIKRCKICDFNFVNENISPQEGSNHLTSETPEDVLNNYYLNYKADEKVAYSSLQRRMPIFEKFYGDKIKNVLEIGCGPATAFSWFKNQNVHWVGNEVDKTALDHAKKLNLPVSSLNIENYKSEFDLIYFHQVLEHVMDPVDFLKKVNSALKPGGIVGIGVPNNNGFTAIFRRFFKNKYPLDYGFIQIPYHLRAYNSKSINNLCNICNFEVCAVNEVTHFDLKYGEWYAKKNSLIARLIFNMGAKLGFGTLLYAIAKKR
jgi:SAM-dependent methyltransferase